MPIKRVTNQAGWFYHVPASKKTTKPVDYHVAISQIPDLSADDDLPEPPRSRFRDTDTKYIRLAKQGGRANLLFMKENEPSNTRGPVLYPRNEWFYLEDNAIKDAIEWKKKDMPFEFMKPDYMVHKPYKSSTNPVHEQPWQGPSTHDKQSMYHLEVDQLETDKTIKLPELMKTTCEMTYAHPLKWLKNKLESSNTDYDKGLQPLEIIHLNPVINKSTKPTQKSTGNLAESQKIRAAHQQKLHELFIMTKLDNQRHLNPQLQPVTH